MIMFKPLGETFRDKSSIRMFWTGHYTFKSSSIPSANNALSITSNSDLAMEAQFLASIDHPNIIKLRGITYSGVSGFTNGPQGYYLIIDMLPETLDHRIQKWRNQDSKECNNVTRKNMVRQASQMFRNSMKLSFVSKQSTGGGGEGVEVEDQSIKQDPNEVMDERLSVGELSLYAMLRIW